MDLVYLESAWLVALEQFFVAEFVQQSELLFEVLLLRTIALNLYLSVWFAGAAIDEDVAMVLSLGYTVLVRLELLIW